tara:strand:+ start:89 stop:544 length:456 start_codon:yes stop_codon:yes gene_type:complete
MYRKTEHLEHYHPTKEEFARLNDLWKSGKLDRHIANLIAFSKNYHNEILSLSPSPFELRDILLTIKRQIVMIGSVNRRSEMDDQIRAIHDEIWIRGENGDFDRKRIQQDWTLQHAENWRRWRIKEYLYLIDHCSERIRSLFQDALNTHHPE